AGQDPKTRLDALAAASSAAVNSV
ncbi:MAG: hypothetical protein QOH45_3578, partial [Pseudonocardiales bacterium]|nr:hypothetical protein [Pseudonocardiales bacterium]